MSSTTPPIPQATGSHVNFQAAPAMQPLVVLPAAAGYVNTGLVRIGDQLPGVYFAGKGAQELAEWSTVLVGLVVRNGVLDNPTLSLCSFVLAHAALLASADPTGNAAGVVAEARHNLDAAVSLLMAPPAGGVPQ